MKMRIPLVACVVVLGWCYAVPADLIVSTDMDLSLAGIQSHRDAMIGDEFGVGIWLELTDATSLAAYSFSVRYNADVLELLKREETLPSGWFPLTPDKPPVEYGADDPTLGPGTYGELDRFDASTFALGPAAPWLFQVATLTFRVNGFPTPGYPTQVLPGMFEEGIDGFLENDGIEMMPFTSQGGGVSVVPEPASLVLFGTALSAVLALLVCRRRTRRG